jgi:hypothetical protein
LSEQADARSGDPIALDLKTVMREVKNAMADRDDVVVDLGDAERMRLEILLEDLQPLIGQVEPGDERFDFTISSGTRPRLWIDAVAHVSMGRDRRTYRFVADSRLGRVVLAESADMRPVALQIARYLAERLIERDRALTQPAQAAGSLLRVQTPGQLSYSRSAEVVALILLGALAGGAGVLAAIWDRIAS